MLWIQRGARFSTCAFIRLASAAKSAVARRIGSANCLNRTYFVAPRLDAGADLVADFACAGQALFTRAGEGRRIWKTPVQSFGHTREDRAPLGATLVAHRDNVGEQFARFEGIEHGLSLLVRNIDGDLAHRFDCQGVKRTGFQSGAVRLKLFAAKLIEKRFGHLAAGAVMNTDEQDFLFHDGVVDHAIKRARITAFSSR
jgi:hypothetical protein